MPEIVFKKLLQEKVIDRVFKLTIFLKGINGILELASGLFLLFAPKTVLSAIFTALVKQELIEDPNDFLVNFASAVLQNMSPTTKFLSIVYLLFHGTINIFLVIGLLRRKFWAYPIAMIFLMLIVFYQTYHLAHLYSWGLCFLTLFDVFIIILIWHEYRYHYIEKKDNK